jgi:dolichol-phosphate mannosyltransferase
VENGSADGLSSGLRHKISRFGTRLALWYLPSTVADPMSGFFALNRNVLMGTVHNLSPMGFKILFDILISAPRGTRVNEVPFQFRDRFSGESKLDSVVLWDFGIFLLERLCGRRVPAKFLSFSLIGGLGVFVHLTVLRTALNFGVPFVEGQGVATATAILFNFFLNNMLTYRDRRLHGWRMARGLAIFYLVCSVGAFANVGVASYLHGNQTQWLLSALAGILVGTLWNFVMSNVFAWKK